MKMDKQLKWSVYITESRPVVIRLKVMDGVVLAWLTVVDEW